MSFVNWHIIMELPFLCSAFLAEYLKYIQLLLISVLGGVYIYFIKIKMYLKSTILPIALLFAGGLSNILDSFVLMEE